MSHHGEDFDLVLPLGEGEASAGNIIPWNIIEATMHAFLAASPDASGHLNWPELLLPLNFATEPSKGEPGDMA
ncbi:MAG: hypothetical protein Q9191_006242 [Dirinaria sp. TL-2023a]